MAALGLILAAVMYRFSENFWKTYVVALIAMATHPLLDLANAGQPGRQLPFQDGCRLADGFRPALGGLMELLRLALRLVIELKRVGRPMMLVLNMFDIATRRGVKIDLKQLSAELGVPVVTSIAVRRGGTEATVPIVPGFVSEIVVP